MVILGGSGFWSHGGDGAVCRQLAPWEVGREKVIDIRVEAKKGEVNK